MRNVESAEAFGRALRDRRLALQLSQEQLALEAGVSRRLVIELEHGKRGVSLDRALRLAAFLGFDVDLVPRERG